MFLSNINGNGWLLYKMVAHFSMRTNGVKQDLDLFKGFGYIERVVKPDFFR